MDNNTSTPRSRPPLKFANRLYEFTSTPKGRTPTPKAGSARRTFNRDDLPSAHLSTNSISAARNIFRASSITNSPAVGFSPQIPPSALRKSFVPLPSPHTKRLFRDSTAQPSPRGVAKPASGEPFFAMNIPEPPPELTGEALARQVPDGWDSKASIYADEYLAHQCPPDFDEQQRRQYFCILDMRRLKYAANEIFVKKDWRLNITNFAKEFEKSRSLILLHYGLYEYKGVKASESVLKKWRAAHGIPDPDEALANTPLKMNGAKSTTLKRKAEEELPPKDTPLAASSANRNKRRAPDSDDEAPVPAPSPNRNKRKASVADDVDENVPVKAQKSTPSATKALFERIANTKGTSTPSKASPPKPAPKQPQFGATLTPNPFVPTAKPINGSLARSVLEGVKPGTPQPTASSNIFGYLSDAGSAQNSGVDADAESSTESEPDTEEKIAAPSYEPSVAASGGADTPSSLPGNDLFARKAPFTSGLATGPSSTSSDARESTPGRSIFDRVTKGNDGQPMRMFGADAAKAKEEAAKPTEPENREPEPKPAPTNNTWTPDTPIKFGAAAPKPGLFGQTAAPASSIFAPKAGAATSLFGAPPKQDKPADGPAQADKPVKTTETDTDKSAGESDKENASQPTVKNLFGSVPKPGETTAQPAFPKPANLFQPKPTEDAAKKDADAAPKPTSSFPAFTPSAAAEAKPASGSATAAAALFGVQGQAKPFTSTASPSPFQSSTLFGAVKPAEPSQPATASSEAPKTSNMFGSVPAGSGTPLFGSQPASNAGSVFGSRATTPKPVESAEPAPKPAAAPIFQFGPATSAAAVEPPPAIAQPVAANLFQFGTAPSTTATEPPKAVSKRVFATPKAPSASRAAALGGSPMKQDEPSPSKKPFAAAGSGLGGSRFATQPAQFGGFGGDQPAAAPASFGGGASGFTFTAGGDQGIRNPFASAGSGASAAPATGGFNFSASQAAPAPSATAGATPFLFGGGAGSTTVPAPAPTSATPFVFGGGPASAAPAAPQGLGSSRFAGGPKPAFSFGAASGNGQTGLGNSPAPAHMQSQKPLFGGAVSSAPVLNFTAASPQQPHGGLGSSIFAPKPNPPASSLFANLQPPAGGASTTGTNSPFNFGGASSLATTPAAGTPEPAADVEQQAPAGGEAGDGEETQEQISLTDGGPGEEDEVVVHDVRAKVLKFVPPGQGSSDDGEQPEAKTKSPWATKGVGAFRLLKHKTTGAVRMLLRAEPRGHVALNRALLPDMKYRAEEKYVKLTTANDDGSGLETWMVQVKTKELAQALATVLEENKVANKK